MPNTTALEVKANLTGDLAVIVRALDLMGKALADHDHVWTDEERAAYESAVRICEDKTRRQVVVSDG